MDLPKGSGPQFIEFACFKHFTGFDRCPPPTGPGVCASNCRPGFYDRCRRTGNNTRFKRENIGLAGPFHLPVVT